MKRGQQLSLGLILLAQLVCFGHTKEDGEASLKVVETYCNQKLSQINSIDDFEYFMKHYEVVMESGLKPRQGLLSHGKNLRSCFDARERLTSLRKLVIARESGVCQMKFINRLIDYHMNFMLKDSAQSKSGPKESDPKSIEEASRATSLRWKFDAHFFSLFTHQVAMTCKSKINERVIEAQAKHDCSSVISLLMPPSNEEELVNAAQDFLKNFKRVEDYAPLVRQHDLEEPYFNVIVSPEARERIETLRELCRQREPYYKSIFAPVALLAQLGYDVEDQTVDSDNLSDKGVKTTKCWLATAQLCQGILRTHLESNLSTSELSGEEIEMGGRKLVQIKFGKLSDDLQKLEASDPEGQCHVDTIDEISPEVVRLVSRKGSMRNKLKRKAFIWASNFLRRHIDIEGKRKQVVQSFIDELTRDSNSLDKPVAFGGQKVKDGRFLPARMITDDADTIVQTGSFFLHKAEALAVSSVVAISLTGAFVWFAFYSAVASCRSHAAANTDGDFKQDWRSQYQKRMQKFEDKKHGWKHKMMVYRGN